MNRFDELSKSVIYKEINVQNMVKVSKIEN